MTTKNSVLCVCAFFSGECVGFIKQSLHNLSVKDEAYILLRYMTWFSTSHLCVYDHSVGLKTKDAGCYVDVVTVFPGVCLHPSPSAGSHGADCSVTELGHGGTCCHNVLFIIAQPMTAAVVTARRGAAGESGEQSLAEACVHEAVNNRVDAGGGVAQQMDKSDRCT